MSSILEVSQPSVDAVTQAEAIAFLRQAVSTPDAALISSIWIPAARRYVERMTGLSLAQRNFVQYEERFPYGTWLNWYDQSRAPVTPRQDYRVPLLRSPVKGVQKVIYVGEDGNLHGMLPGQDFAVDYASLPGHITPLPGSNWPLLYMSAFPEELWLTGSWFPGVSSLNRVQIFLTAGYTALPTDVENILLGAQWQPYLAFPQYSYVVDPNGNLQVQIKAGSPLSGSDPPTYAAVGQSIQDGACVWFNAGPAGVGGPVIDGSGNPVVNSPISPALYQTSQVYPAPSIVVDGNGNLEFTQAGLTSGAAPPTWPTGANAAGTSTSDNGGTWICLGPPENAGASPPSQLVQYQGDTGIPEDLKMAVLLMVSHFYYNREPVVEGREGKVADVPHSVSQICDNYRVWDFGQPSPELW